MQFALILIFLTLSATSAFVPQRHNRYKHSFIKLNEQKYEIVPLGLYRVTDICFAPSSARFFSSLLTRAFTHSFAYSLRHYFTR